MSEKLYPQGVTVPNDPPPSYPGSAPVTANNVPYPRQEGAAPVATVGVRPGTMSE